MAVAVPVVLDPLEAAPVVVPGLVGALVVEVPLHPVGAHDEGQALGRTAAQSAALTGAGRGEEGDDDGEGAPRDPHSRGKTSTASGARRRDGGVCLWDG